MSSASNTPGQFTVTLSDAERTTIVNYLQQALQDTHAEARRTESPSFQEQVHREEALLRGLLNKLRAV